MPALPNPPTNPGDQCFLQPDGYLQVPVLRGPDDGSGLVTGKVGTAPGTGSAPQIPSFTEAQRDFLVGAEGMIVFNTTVGAYQIFSNGVWQQLALSTLGSDFIPSPESRVAANATRVQPTVYYGCSYRTPQPITFNRLVTRVTALTAPVDLQLAIYQSVGGGGGAVASLVATCNFTPGAAGNFQITPVEGTVRLQAGIFFLLCGRYSAGGSGTLRVYTVQANDLLNTNVEPGTHPVSFTTTIPVTVAPPATFDPTGVAVTPVTTNLIPIIRMRRV